MKTTIHDNVSSDISVGPIDKPKAVVNINSSNLGQKQQVLRIIYHRLEKFWS